MGARPVVLKSGSQTVATPSTAVALAPARTFAHSVIIQAKLVAGDNTGNVHIGLSALDQGVAELIELIPGADMTIDVGPDAVFDLATIYVDADTASDGVTFLYVPE